MATENTRYGSIVGSGVDLRKRPLSQGPLSMKKNRPLGYKPRGRALSLAKTNAEDQSLLFAISMSRNSRRRTFSTLLLGNSSKNSTKRGTLYLARFSRQ